AELRLIQAIEQSATCRSSSQLPTRLLCSMETGEPTLLADAILRGATHPYRASVQLGRRATNVRNLPGLLDLHLVVQAAGGTSENASRSHGLHKLCRKAFLLGRDCASPR